MAGAFMLLPFFANAQADLLLGLNYSYNPPSGCNNQVTNLTVDICNNGNSSASSFEVGAYLYNPSNSQYWVIASTTVNSLSGSACITISNWNIDMNTYCCLPAPGSNYRLGIWVDTANVITESDENNNASLLSGNIQICAASGIKTIEQSIGNLDLYPNPSPGKCSITLNLLKGDDITVSVYDVTGKLQMMVAEGSYTPGTHKFSIETSLLENGIYFLKVSSAQGSVTKKLIVQR